MKPIINNTTKVKLIINDVNEASEYENEELKINKRNIEFNNCIFNRVNLTKSQIEDSYFVDVVFNNCDLSNIIFNRSTFHRIEFNNCKLVGTSFIDNSVENVIFNNCVLKYSNISTSKLRY